MRSFRVRRRKGDRDGRENRKRRKIRLMNTKVGMEGEERVKVGGVTGRGGI